MNGTKNKSSVYFLLIAAVAFCGAFFIGGFLKDFYFDAQKFVWLSVIFILPLIVHGVVGFSFFKGWIGVRDSSSSNVVGAMFISVQIFALFAIFDLIMRLMQRTEWMLSSVTPFIGDVTWILLLGLWMWVRFVEPDMVS